MELAAAGDNMKKLGPFLGPDSATFHEGLQLARERSS
jgi:hypothetical protein